MPVALFASLPYLHLGAPVHSERIVSLARDWLARPTDRVCSPCFTTPGAFSSRRTQATSLKRQCERTRTSLLRWPVSGTATHSLASTRCSRIDASPSARDVQLESVISDAMHYHRSLLIRDLGAALRSDTLQDDLRGGALLLAGYFGDRSLGGDVRSAWEKARDKSLMLRAGLWAGLRCADNDPASVLDPLFDALLRISDEPTQYGQSDRGAIVHDLASTADHGFSESVLNHLVTFGMRGDRERDVVTALLDDMDHPIAVSFVARQLAGYSHRASHSGTFSPWALAWENRWDRYLGKPPLSRGSLEALAPSGRTNEERDWVKRYAFGIWACAGGDLPELRQVGFRSPFYSTALWNRALQGDVEVLPDILALISKDRSWFDVLALIWASELEPVVDSCSRTSTLAGACC